MKPVIIKLCVLVVLLIAVLSVKSIVLGGATPVSLQSAPALSGQISQAFTSSGSKTLPVVNRDYALQDIHYFDDRQWVVVSIKAKDVAVTDGLAVLQKQNGIYTVVLGPGSSFPVSATMSMPQDVGQYLEAFGATYESE